LPVGEFACELCQYMLSTQYCCLQYSCVWPLYRYDKSYYHYPFSALTMLVGQWEGHRVCENILLQQSPVVFLYRPLGDPVLPGDPILPGVISESIPVKWKPKTHKYIIFDELLICYTINKWKRVALYYELIYGMYLVWTCPAPNSPELSAHPYCIHSQSVIFLSLCFCPHGVSDASSSF